MRAALYRESGFVPWHTASEIDLNKSGVSGKRTFETVEQTVDRRIASLILSKHQDHNYLVQCSVLVDVTRAQRLVTVCYELK